MLALLVVFGLFRVDPFDVPEHLAVGRIIWETGSPMTTNALSWSFPDHPNDQQYPLYQVAIYVLQVGLGWWSLSVFCCVTWAAAVLAWGAWGGGVQRAARTVPVWFLAVLGVQRHLVARPEVFTLLGLALLLLAWQWWRRDRGWRPLAAQVATLWVMVNTHQMYIIGAVLLAGFAIHVGLTRALAGRGWVDESDADLPLRPLILTLLAGIGVMALSPLGPRAWVAPFALVTTMTSLGSGTSQLAESRELDPIWTDPIGGPVTALFLVVLVVAGWRARGRWSVLELGVLAMGLVLVAAALRGIPFFALAAAAVITRWDAKSEALVPEESWVPGAFAATTALLAGVLAVALSLPQPHAYLFRQQGLGRSVGEWAETSIAFLVENPPPGEMMNIGWVAANYLNYGVYPTRRVFVDGRWEAYPKPFLARTIAATRDQGVLDDLIEQWDPGFIVAEMREADQQDRVAALVQRRWTLVHVDSILAVVVPPSPRSAAYRAEFGLDPSEIEPADWLVEHPILYAQQQVRVGSLLARLGEAELAEALFLAAGEQAEHPAVAADLARFR